MRFEFSAMRGTARAEGGLILPTGTLHVLKKQEVQNSDAIFPEQHTSMQVMQCMDEKCKIGKSNNRYLWGSGLEEVK